MLPHTVCCALFFHFSCIRSFRLRAFICFQLCIQFYDVLCIIINLFSISLLYFPLAHICSFSFLAFFISFARFIVFFCLNNVTCNVFISLLFSKSWIRFNFDSIDRLPGKRFPCSFFSHSINVRLRSKVFFVVKRFYSLYVEIFTHNVTCLLCVSLCLLACLCNLFALWVLTISTFHGFCFVFHIFVRSSSTHFTTGFVLFPRLRFLLQFSNLKRSHILHSTL